MTTTTITVCSNLTLVTRGNPVRIRKTFYDLDDEVVNPASATLYVCYPLNGASETELVVMEQSGDVWSGTWQSSVSDPGRVRWSIRSVDPEFAEDGVIRLVGNAANHPPGTGT
jgi:hypothetical protein